MRCLGSLIAQSVNVFLSHLVQAGRPQEASICGVSASTTTSTGSQIGKASVKPCRRGSEARAVMLKVHFKQPIR